MINRYTNDMHILSAKISSLAVVVVLLGLPFLMWSERAAGTTWVERLVIPHIEETPDRHTPRFSQGTYLPPVVTRDTTLNATQNPILVAHTTRIPAGVTLTVTPGVQFYFHEFATLVVEGELMLGGTDESPITLSSNELHPANQLWNGIIFMPGSSAGITGTTIQQATPAISCLPSSHVRIGKSRLVQATTGVFTKSSDCHITDSTIQASQYGVIAVDVEPVLTNTTITAGKTPVHHTQASRELH